MYLNQYNYMLSEEQTSGNADIPRTLMNQMENLQDTLRCVRCVWQTITALDGSVEGEVLLAHYADDLKDDLFRIGAFLTETAQQECSQVWKAVFEEKRSEDHGQEATTQSEIGVKREG